MTTWFRMYAETLNDPKVQTLPADAFKAWVNILCLAASTDGRAATESEIAFALRLTPAKAKATVRALKQASLLDGDETGYLPHNWNGRQFKSDVSNDRVKRFRKRQGNGECNVTSSVTETPPETETESEQNREKEQNGAQSALAPDDLTAIPESLRRKEPEEIQKAFDNWNIVAEELGLPKAQVLTRDRKQKLQQRLNEHGLEGWNKALLNLEASEFCRGKNDRNWKANLEFLLQPSSLNKLIEGAYGPES